MALSVSLRREPKLLVWLWTVRPPTTWGETWAEGHGSWVEPEQSIKTLSTWAEDLVSESEPGRSSAGSRYEPEQGTSALIWDLGRRPLLCLPVVTHVTFHRVYMSVYQRPDEIIFFFPNCFGWNRSPYCLYSPLPPLSGQPTGKCHPRWQPIKGLAIHCRLGRLLDLNPGLQYHNLVSLPMSHHCSLTTTAPWATTAP